MPSLAYFGTFDENASVAKCWESAWEELSGGGVGATGGGSAIGKHFPNLWKSFLKPHLEGSNYSLKSRAGEDDIVGDEKYEFQHQKSVDKQYGRDEC